MKNTLPQHLGTGARRLEIETALASGKVVRFHYPHGIHKDVNALTLNDVGDLVSFRRSGGFTAYVCWDSPELSVEVVDA